MNLNFCVLCALACVGVCEAMTFGDEGVCQKTERKTKLVKETYAATCEGRPCLKTRKVPKTYFPTYCCDGYEWDTDSDTCKPFCLHGCMGGKCVAPNKCQCEPPLISVNDKCTLPVCNPPCTNGNCTAPNTCSCNEGYLLKEDKHTCAAQCTDCEHGECRTPNVCECNEGYARRDNQCKPVCRSECNNGFCAAPDVCLCNEGYESKNNTCVPVCGEACVNANCVAPNTCTCFAGFEATAKKEVCEPKCDSCVHGDCVGPNQCECHEGYTSIDKVCRPICKDKCVNAACVAPNTCMCLPGFEETVNKEVCRPKCDACINGDCVAPNECACHKGYAFKNGSCIPTCDNTCVNANCVEPNKCQCLDGFEPTAKKEACKPKCDSCVHGDCVKPNQCECHKGYTSIDQVCSPICEDECVNSTCVAPNTCTCLTGFEHTAKKEVCRPKCESCVHGDCVGPNQCSCHKGYALIGKVCKPICEEMCVKGNCVAPNKCECLDGYEPKLGHEAVCMPKCDSCANGECTAPNKCVCHRGYARMSNGCKPICKDACINGDCTAPNKCSCNEGYTRNMTDPSICYKACSDCGMGTCSLDGECICGTDSKLVNGTCHSLNGIEASGMASTPGLASLEMSWLVGGAVCVLLVVLAIVVIQRMWRRRKDYGPKGTDNANTYGSVIYTLPDTLIRNNEVLPQNDVADEDQNESDDEGTSKKLMASPNGIV